VGGDSRVVCRDAMGIRGHDRRDLERERLRVGVCPERRAAGCICNGERERQAAVGKRDGVEPVTELGRLPCRGGPHFGEHLEGMQRRGRLAFRRAEVGLEAVPVASVWIAVGAERGKGRLGVAAVEELLEPPPVEEPRMARHEPPRGGDIRAHFI
jgi:hypothetical protein